MPKTIFCTIVSASYLNQALSAIDSLQNYHKEFDYLVAVIDLEEEFIFKENNLQIVSLHKLIEIFPEIKNFNSSKGVILAYDTISKIILSSYINE